MGPSYLALINHPSCTWGSMVVAEEVKHCAVSTPGQKFPPRGRYLSADILDIFCSTSSTWRCTPDGTHADSAVQISGPSPRRLPDRWSTETVSRLVLAPSCIASKWGWWCACRLDRKRTQSNSRRPSALYVLNLCNPHNWSLFPAAVFGWFFAWAWTECSWGLSWALPTTPWAFPRTFWSTRTWQFPPIRSRHPLPDNSDTGMSFSTEAALREGTWEGKCFQWGPCEDENHGSTGKELCIYWAPSAPTCSHGRTRVEGSPPRDDVDPIY